MLWRRYLHHDRPDSLVGGLANSCELLAPVPFYPLGGPAACASNTLQLAVAADYKTLATFLDTLGFIRRGHNVGENYESQTNGEKS